MKLGFLSKIFEGALSIEKTYNECDKALSELRVYNQNRQKGQLPTEKKEALDAVVNTALENANRILSKEGERNWPGVFREMHKNLADIYLELDQYDKVREACERLQDYGTTGKQDADAVMQNLKEKEGNASE